jgi:hypothetical protein
MRMVRFAFPLLSLVLVVGCAPAQAPVESAAPAAPPAPATAPVTPATEPAATIAGTPCMAATENAPPSPFLPDTPAGVVQGFYALDAVHAGGAMDADALAKAAPMLTRELAAALERARAERDRALQENPGDKPPYVEGALFSSLFEGYSKALPLTVATEGDHARVPVCFAYADDSGRTEWTDTVVLLKQDGAWRIDDVAYGGQWDFANTGTLRDALPKAQ